MNRKIEMQNTKITTPIPDGFDPTTDTPPHPCIFSVLGDTELQECKCTPEGERQVSIMETQNKNIQGGAVLE